MKIIYQNFWHNIRSKIIQQNRELLNKIKNIRKPSFVQTDIL